jgi:hypothetical protein
MRSSLKTIQSLVPPGAAARVTPVQAPAMPLPVWMPVVTVAIAATAVLLASGLAVVMSMT